MPSEAESRVDLLDQRQDGYKPRCECRKVQTRIAAQRIMRRARWQGVDDRADRRKRLLRIGYEFFVAEDSLVAQRQVGLKLESQQFHLTRGVSSAASSRRLM